MIRQIGSTKRAQAALEFLTTYGWAFLVILIMVSALGYFGVLDPSRFLPDKCIFGTGVGGCMEFTITTNYIVAEIKNNLGMDVNINSANVTVSGTTTVCSPMNISFGQNPSGAIPYIANTLTTLGTWNSSTVIGLNISCVTSTLATGERPTARVSIVFTPVGKSFARTVEGEIMIRKTS